MIPAPAKDVQLNREMDFLGMLGHELRNALNAISMSHAIIDQYPPQNAVEERARVVARRQTAHLTRLVNNLVDVSRFARGKITLDRRRIDLGAVVTRAAALVREHTLSTRNQRVETSVPDARLDVRGDELRLEQLLVHLLEYVANAAAEGAVITVTVTERPAQREAVVTIVVPGDSMTSEQLATMFNLFHGNISPQPMGTSVGIELALVRALVESHGGSVSARSESMGREYAYEVRLPLAEGSDEEEAPASASLVEPGVVS